MPVRHFPVGNDQFAAAPAPPRPEEDIEIKWARSPAFALTPAKLLFHIFQRLQQLGWRQSGFNGNGGICIGAPRGAYRPAHTDAGACGDPYVSGFAQYVHRQTHDRGWRISSDIHVGTYAKKIKFGHITAFASMCQTPPQCAGAEQPSIIQA